VATIVGYSRNVAFFGLRLELLFIQRAQFALTDD
jgi:hypothetical protein